MNDDTDSSSCIGQDESGQTLSTTCDDRNAAGDASQHSSGGYANASLFSQSCSFKPRPINADEAWNRIRNVVDLVMNGQTCSHDVWNDCFFDVYALCNAIHVTNLYNNIINYLLTYVEALKEKLDTIKGVTLLEMYAAYWQKYNEGVKRVHDLFLYVSRMMNREHNWRSFEENHPYLFKDLGKRPLHISEAARLVWRRYLLVPLQDELFSVIWDEFLRTRNSNYACSPNDAVKPTISSFINVCFSSNEEEFEMMTAIDNNLAVYSAQRSPPSCERLKFYEEYFEQRFLKATEEYFKSTITLTLDSDSMSGMFDYMQRAKTVLEREEQLCLTCLCKTTVDRMLQLLRIAFVLYQIDRFALVVSVYISKQSKKELHLCYLLLAPFTEGITLLVREYEKYVRRVLCESLDGDGGSTPTAFVETICEQYKYFFNFTAEVFDHAHTLTSGYRKAIESVINEERGGEKYYAVRMVARQMDQLLKKAPRTKVVDIEEKMDATVTVFRFIKDKDIFLKFYQRAFSNRLLGKLTGSLEQESCMIEKLRDACGHDYTNKLVRMYTDYENSKKLSEEFEAAEKSCECKHRAEDEYTVIQTCAWPVASSREEASMSSLIIPPWLSQSTDCFKTFYEQKHSGRILNFAYHVSTADVLIDVGARKCTATMTIPQTILLLCFNTADDLTIGYLSNTCGLTFEATCNCLKALIDFKVLKMESANRTSSAETLVQFNAAFGAQRSRAHLPTQALSGRTSDANTTVMERDLLPDRKVTTECAIMRTMKARKIVDHQRLMTCVIQLVQNRFEPDVAFIKSCIESLIDKHFIQRTNNVSEYEYLS